jgi:NitT/TauT family transport system permease protein
VPLVVFHTRRVREALKAQESWLVDVLVLASVAALGAAMISFGRQFSAPYHAKTVIDLSFSSLPKYTFFSLCRGFAAYVLSLIFTLVYGTIAAHNHRAEKVMIPVLDVLQAIPVLGFLPGLVLAMIALFPTREIGLEIACIVMIFTGQAWNMVFSFHGSLRGIPTPLREVAKLQKFGGWKTFKLLEVPAAMIGLVWNSMMSMAGGWFFLTVNEAFTLGDRDYRLPGIGSYMNEAITRGNTPAMIAAIIAMVIMIVLVDQVFWRPIVVWSQKYKLEESADVDKPQSWVLNVLQHSRLYEWVVRRLSRPRETRLKLAGISRAATGERGGALWGIIRSIVQWLVMLAVVVVTGWGAYELAKLLLGLPLHDSAGEDWPHVLLALACSFVRTTMAVAFGAAWALPAGIMIGLSPRWSQRLQPIIQVVASFPAPMLFPLVTILLVLLHFPFTAGCVALMLLGSQWYILFNVIAGASAIPGDLKEVADVYHMSRWRRWTTLYIPCVFPYLVTGLITAAGGAWNATIVSEYVQVKQQTFTAFGLGSIISRATTEANFHLLCAAVVTMAAFVVMANRFFWKRLYRLAEARYSLNV